MLYPIELTFENAREFKKQSVYFADPKGFENIYEIANHYKDNVLIGGLNGTGKSTIAAVFICILNADVNEADPIDLISSSQAYTNENPWLFKGRLIFYNDGSLEDNKMFIEVNARFEGVTEHEKPKIRSKYFTIRESDTIEGLRNAREYVYSNKNDKYGRLDEFRKQVEALGISPDKYLLYWKQGETSKFTQIKDVERFTQLARMMGIEESINNLDRMIQSQAEKEKEVNIVHNNCLQLEIDLRKKEIDKQEKERRDEELMESSAQFVGSLNTLIHYNRKISDELQSKKTENQQALSERGEQKAKVEEKLNSIVQEKSNVQKDYDQCIAETKIVNEQMLSVGQMVSRLEKEIDEGKNKYQQINEFLDILKKEELGVEELQKLINKYQSELITINLSIEQNESMSNEQKKLAKEIEEKLKALESNKGDLERQIILAEQFLKDNPKETTLREWIESIFIDYDDKRRVLSKREKDKFCLETELISMGQAFNLHVKLLEEETANLTNEITKEETQVKQCQSDLQKLNNEKIIIENELSKESPEQLNKSISLLIGENENLTALRNNYKEIVEKLGPTVVGLYHSSRKISDDLSNQIKEIEQGMQEVKTQKKMTEQSIDSLSTERLKIQEELKGYVLNSEGYTKKIKESRNIENELRLETARINQYIVGLNNELVNIEQGIFDTSQQESIEKQGFETYAFQDIFEFKDAELDQ